jgi:hypothetical protein
MPHKIAFNLSVSISKQGRRFVAYSPALDISTSGKSEKDVQTRFSEIAQVFFEEIHEAGTTEAVLSELGWNKKQKEWTPPRVISTKSVGVRVPAFA